MTVEEVTIDSARKAQERWKMLSSSAMDKDGDMSG